ncbi:MAG: 16S rRNA (cytosine(1402)-N(4))-methyltransferase RsmH [Ardenticatenaceae bacterium]|nr:16S rRNA (cytosine(1402)-N(4))-methyltransferase RsmH [Anaerolineales bacterium]MCB8918370.1 16S rRNA (cytosine(1402)-N(4))-methyltransferase RsmH [Ardenticatenaceae bacterium]
MENQAEHVPVLYHEVLALLQPRPGGLYIDGTVGAGGHTAGILTASAPAGRVLAFDRDPEAIAYARQRLQAFGDRITFVTASYAEMGRLAPQHHFAPVDGVLLDLGLSSRQLDAAERGFSLRQEGPLDMRFDPTHGPSAADLVNNLPAAELADIFWRYGEERQSRRYAQAIVAARPVYTTTQLAGIIAREARGPRRRIHPATQVFQALRIAVNEELAMLETGLLAAIDLLKPSGRVAVISFHSLEDRFVKQTFRQLSQTCTCPPGQPVCTCNTRPTLQLVSRKALKPDEAEIAQNPRSRSARLRVAQKLA